MRFIYDFTYNTIVQGQRAIIYSGETRVSLSGSGCHKQPTMWNSYGVASVFMQLNK